MRLSFKVFILISLYLRGVKVISAFKRLNEEVIDLIKVCLNQMYFKENKLILVNFLFNFY